MTLNSKTRNDIENAIQKLKLTENELKVVTVGNLKKISALADVDMHQVMYYLRFER